jgi:hypothetical protein
MLVMAHFGCSRLWFGFKISSYTAVRWSMARLSIVLQSKCSSEFSQRKGVALRYNTSQKHVDRLDTGDQSVQHVKFPTVRIVRVSQCYTGGWLGRHLAAQLRARFHRVIGQNVNQSVEISSALHLQREVLPASVLPWSNHQHMSNQNWVWANLKFLISRAL